MKVVIELNNRKFVVDPEVAERILSEVHGAEEYTEKWNRPDGGGDSFYTYHIHEAEPKPVALPVLSEAQYKMYKLAGKPE